MGRIFIGLALFAVACGPEESAAVNEDAAAKNPAVSDTAPAAVIGDAPSVCEMVSNNDLEIITGQKFDNGVTLTREPQVNRCGFAPAGGAATGRIAVSLYLENVADSKTAFQITPDMTPITATDVGDAAYWSATQRAFIARKENRIITVSFDTDGAEQQRWGAQIARRAFERM